MLPREYAIKWQFLSAPHLINASALPGETQIPKIATFHLNITTRPVYVSALLSECRYTCCCCSLVSNGYRFHLKMTIKTVYVMVHAAPAMTVLVYIGRLYVRASSAASRTDY